MATGAVGIAFGEYIDTCSLISSWILCLMKIWTTCHISLNSFSAIEAIGLKMITNMVTTKVSVLFPSRGPDTDIETEMQLASARQIKAEDATDDDIPSSSGRQFTNSNVTKHFGQSPFPAYEPAFDWGNERSMIFGQRIPETPTTQYGSGLKISVKVLSLSFQAGLVEPFYGTICIYNRERREKLSEDFYFSVLPSEMQDAKVPLEPHGIFYLDASSISICLLIQLEKPATEEGGVTPLVYSRKEPERLDYLEDGKSIFKLRLRLCSFVYPINERIRDFFLEYDRHTLRTSPLWGSELLEAINSLKNVDSTALLQFLHPILNMLLHLVGNGGETLQAAAFRAMVNILTRVQQESVDDAERNRSLVNYVDYSFDDFGGCQPPVYLGLSTVWGSLARSKVKGYRVGPVYDDVLAMAWFLLELIV